MITIGKDILRKQPNFWNHCLFHPTDAVEDPWGRRILDKMSEDKAIKTIRIYTMFEDIVYLDENGQLAYDFRLSDLRLDYLVEKGYDLLLAYGGIPDCIASSTAYKTSISHNKTRYKGKMWNSAPPEDPAVWEEICYQYTKHNVERYGIERVSRWHNHCLNEADYGGFFLSQYPLDAVDVRVEAYCKLYEAFLRGVLRVSEKLIVGGPALAYQLGFLDKFFTHVKEHNLRLDYICFHIYGASPHHLHSGEKKLTVRNNMEQLASYMDVIRAHGFEHKELIMDEWGGTTAGFFNKGDAPELMYRETEVFSAYFVKLIHTLIHSEYELSKMMICLSGQHEMTEEFTGFRGFFTLNFLPKPIYNSYVLASRLGHLLLDVQAEDPNLAVIPTKTPKGYAILLTYAGDCFEESLPELEETLSLPADSVGKSATVWCIDRQTANAYRFYEKMAMGTPTKEDLKLLREKGRLEPVSVHTCTGKETLKLTANCTYLITVEG